MRKIALVTFLHLFIWQEAQAQSTLNKALLIKSISISDVIGQYVTKLSNMNGKGSGRLDDNSCLIVSEMIDEESAKISDITSQIKQNVKDFEKPNNISIDDFYGSLNQQSSALIYIVRVKVYMCSSSQEEYYKGFKDLYLELADARLQMSKLFLSKSTR